MVGFFCPLCIGSLDDMCCPAGFRPGAQPGTFVRREDEFDFAAKEAAADAVEHRPVDRAIIVSRMKARTEEFSPRPIVVVLAQPQQRQRCHLPRKVSMRASRCFSRVRH